MGSQGVLEGQQSGMDAMWLLHLWFDSSKDVFLSLSSVACLIQAKKKQKTMGISLTLSYLFPLFSPSLAYIHPSMLGGGSGTAFMAPNNNNNTKRAKNLL